jgi:pantoate--beta-alanine ligase
MILARTLAELDTALVEARKSGRSIGFVPTMGALHQGHASLLRRSRAENELTVLSIYVNPTQFGPAEDFSKYPRPLDADLAIAEQEGVAIVFLPEDSTIYPPGFSTYVNEETVSKPLCGAVRAGHFRGVATVVVRLFNLVEPSRAYFGLKDLQQCLVLKRVVRDLNLPVQLVLCPTVRESDGLALSSRNRYLSPEERAVAPLIYEALQRGRSLFEQAFKEGRGPESVKQILEETAESSKRRRLSKFSIWKFCATPTCSHSPSFRSLRCSR